MKKWIIFADDTQTRPYSVMEADIRPESVPARMIPPGTVCIGVCGTRQEAEKEVTNLNRHCHETYAHDGDLSAEERRMR